MTATNALDAAEARARALVGGVETEILPTIRRHDLGTWAAVTNDARLAAALERTQPATTSSMYLVGQLHPHPWPNVEWLRPDGLATRDSPGARGTDPIAVLHGGGSVDLFGGVTEGVAYHARREVVGVERKGSARPFLRVTVHTDFCDQFDVLVATYREHIILREVGS